MNAVDTNLAEDNKLTVEQIKSALPKNLRVAASQELADKINQASLDPIMAQHIRENFISYTTVLKDGKYKMEDYLNAATYVRFKLMGFNNEEAYQRTFPQRHENLVARGASRKDISAYVAAFHKGKLVNSIMEQTLIPVWVLNQDIYQKAINTQAELMLNANSELVRSNAADSLMNHLKKPEVKEVNLNLGAKENEGVKELNETLRKLAEQQQLAIGNGVTTREIAAQPIYEAEYTDVAKSD